MPQEIDIRQLRQYGSLELVARQVVEGFITGLHKSPFHGFSVEFAEHRLYNKGESTRDIDWKLYARTDRLFSKRYEEETNLRCRIVLDNSSSMQFPFADAGRDVPPLNKISFSVYCAAALITLLKKQRDAVGLSVFTGKLDLHTQARSAPSHSRMLFAELEKLLRTAGDGTGQPTSAASVLHEIAERTHKRSLVAIFSDMMDTDGDGNDLFAALQHLRHNKHEVILFHVTDKSREGDFAYDNRPYRFIDAESGHEVRLHPAEVKEAYVSRIAAYNKELKLRCGQYNIDFIGADISGGFNRVLLPYLVKRSRLY